MEWEPWRALHMSDGPTFLVVDFHAESRYLLVKTLARKFPRALILEFDEGPPAFAIARSQAVDAVISHRTFELSGAELVKTFRAIDATVLIVMVSGIDREDEALQAGATAFLHYDEWLRIGTLVEQHLIQRTGLSALVGFRVGV